MTKKLEDLLTELTDEELEEMISTPITSERTPLTDKLAGLGKAFEEHIENKLESKDLVKLIRLSHLMEMKLNISILGEGRSSVSLKELFEIWHEMGRVLGKPTNG